MVVEKHFGEIHRLRNHACVSVFWYSSCYLGAETYFKLRAFDARIWQSGGILLWLSGTSFYGRHTLTLELWSQCSMWNFVIISIYIYTYIYIHICTYMYIHIYVYILISIVEWLFVVLDYFRVLHLILMVVSHSSN